jgi:hypothetical protein
VHLLGLVAVAIHNLAINIFRSLHPTGIPERPPLPTGERAVLVGPNDGRTFPDGEPRPDFFHRSYYAWKQYPNGIFETVGYWAESQALGGVILFDHEEDESISVSSSSVSSTHPPKHSNLSPQTYCTALSLDQALTMSRRHKELSFTLPQAA